MGITDLLFGSSREVDRLKKQQLSDLSALMDDARSDYSQARDSGLRDMKTDYLSQLFSSDPAAVEQFNAPYVEAFQRDVLPSVAERLGAYGGHRSSGYRQGLSDVAMKFGSQLAGQRSTMQQGALSALTADYDNAANRYSQLASAPVDASQYGGMGLLGGAIDNLRQGNVPAKLGSFAADYLFPGAWSLLSGLIGTGQQKMAPVMPGSGPTSSMSDTINPSSQPYNFNRHSNAVINATRNFMQRNPYVTY